MAEPVRWTIGEMSARLAELRERMASTPIWLRDRQPYSDMARERQKLLAMREAMLRLEQLSQA